MSTPADRRSDPAGIVGTRSLFLDTNGIAGAAGTTDRAQASGDCGLAHKGSALHQPEGSNALEPVFKTWSN